MDNIADLIELHGVSCLRAENAAVCNFSATFEAGHVHLLAGDAGSANGLLKIIGLLEFPDAGDVLIGGRSTRELSTEARAELRAARFGFVFAAPFLLTSFTAIENVAMPLFKISHVSPDEARRRSEALLDFAGLAAVAEVPASELPLGARYHLAVARALANEPAFLLVENIDGTLTGEDLTAFADLLRRVPERFGTGVIATASAAFPHRESDRVFEIQSGEIGAEIQA